MTEHEWRLSLLPAPGSPLPEEECGLCGARSATWEAQRYLLEILPPWSFENMVECPDTCEETAVLLVMRQ